jgi:hypothetical protein
MAGKPCIGDGFANGAGRAQRLWPLKQHFGICSCYAGNFLEGHFHGVGAYIRSNRTEFLGTFR